MLSKLPKPVSTKRERSVGLQPLLKVQKATPGGSSSSKDPPSREGSQEDGKSKYNQEIKEVAAELFLDNKLSALDIYTIVRSANDSGAKGLEHLSKAGNSGAREKNLARDLLKQLLKKHNSARCVQV